MKHFLSFIALFFLLKSASAQFSKGDKLIGGTVQFSKISSFDIPPSSGGIISDKNSTVSFLPSFSFFTSSSLSHGVRLKGSSYFRKMTYDDGTAIRETKYTRKEIGAGYFLRKYFPVIEKMGFYGELAPQFLFMEDKQGGLSNSYYKKGYEISFPIGTGLYYLTGKKSMLSVDLTLANISRSSSDWSGVIWETKGLLSSGIGFSGYYRF